MAACARGTEIRAAQLVILAASCNKTQGAVAANGLTTARTLIVDLELGSGIYQLLHKASPDVHIDAVTGHQQCGQVEALDESACKTHVKMCKCSAAC
jgi:hypothetical protein